MEWCNTKHDVKVVASLNTFSKGADWKEPSSLIKKQNLYTIPDQRNINHKNEHKKKNTQNEKGFQHCMKEHNKQNRGSKVQSITNCCIFESIKVTSLRDRAQWSAIFRLSIFG